MLFVTTLLRQLKVCGRFLSVRAPNRSAYAKGFNPPLSAGTIHGCASLNGVSHPTVFFVWFWCRMEGLEGLLF